ERRRRRNVGVGINRRRSSCVRRASLRRQRDVTALRSDSKQGDLIGARQGGQRVQPVASARLALGTDWCEGGEDHGADLDPWLTDDAFPIRGAVGDDQVHEPPTLGTPVDIIFAGGANGPDRQRLLGEDLLYLQVVAG